MGSTPARLLIEAFLMTFNTIPAGVVRTIIGAKRLDHVRGFAVATLASMNSKVLY
jgi:hypothetical protein